MDKKRMFLHRDEGAERGFKSDYITSLSRANKWIIPIMKKFGIPITLDSVIEYSVAGDLRKAVVAYLTRKCLNGIDADLMTAIDIHKTQETRYNETIKRLIDGLVQKEVEESRSLFEKGKHDYAFSLIETNKRCSILERKLEEYEDAVVTPEQNFRLHVSQCKLGSARNFLILNDETLEFDDAKIQEKCNVYAEGESEIRLIEKLQLLANLINEIYGKSFNPIYDLSRCTFFEFSKDGVKINSEIKKDEIILYSKNI